MSNESIKDKSVDELYQLLEELTKEQIGLKLRKATGQISAPHRIRLVRKNIARVKTHLHSLNLSGKSQNEAGR